MKITNNDALTSLVNLVERFPPNLHFRQFRRRNGGFNSLSAGAYTIARAMYGSEFLIDKQAIKLYTYFRENEERAVVFIKNILGETGYITSKFFDDTKIIPEDNVLLSNASIGIFPLLNEIPENLRIPRELPSRKEFFFYTIPNWGFDIYNVAAYAIAKSALEEKPELIDEQAIHISRIFHQDKKRADTYINDIINKKDVKNITKEPRIVALTIIPYSKHSAYFPNYNTNIELIARIPDELHTKETREYERSRINAKLYKISSIVIASAGRDVSEDDDLVNERVNKFINYFSSNKEAEQLIETILGNDAMTEILTEPDVWYNDFLTKSWDHDVRLGYIKDRNAYDGLLLKIGEAPKRKFTTTKSLQEKLKERHVPAPIREEVEPIPTRYNTPKDLQFVSIASAGGSKYSKLTPTTKDKSTELYKQAEQDLWKTNIKTKDLLKAHRSLIINDDNDDDDKPIWLTLVKAEDLTKLYKTFIKELGEDETKLKAKHEILERFIPLRDTVITLLEEKGIQGGTPEAKAYLMKLGVKSSDYPIELLTVRQIKEEENKPKSASDYTRNAVAEGEIPVLTGAAAAAAAAAIAGGLTQPRVEQPATNFAEILEASLRPIIERQEQFQQQIQQRQEQFQQQIQQRQEQFQQQIQQVLQLLQAREGSPLPPLLPPAQRVAQSEPEEVFVSHSDELAEQVKNINITNEELFQINDEGESDIGEEDTEIVVGLIYVFLYPQVALINGEVMRGLAGFDFQYALEIRGLYIQLKKLGTL